MIEVNTGLPLILIKEPRLLGYSTKVIELASRAGLKSRLMGGTNAVLQGLPRAKTITGMRTAQLFG
jgi:hypothetical protein